MTSDNRLHRSSKNKVIFGVAGGLADYFDIDPVLMRVIFVLIVLISGGAAVLAYLLTALVLPRDDSEAYLSGVPGSGLGNRAGLFATLLIIVGVFALLANLNLFWWLSWGVLWPAVLIVIGASIIFGTLRRN